ncbi:MAG: amidohydrolase family protein [Chloroflexota bacterium]|nr:amidohydrolase family protein [Dehalococcoidia bacterium]MDW8253720.1 amidohydrolase family protein [Chloroflexota bacterium]
MLCDAHTHIFPPAIVAAPDAVDDPYFRELYAAPRPRLADGPALLRLMDQAEVAQAVIVGWGWRDLEQCRRGNDYLLEEAARQPRRFIPFVTVPPLAGEAALREIERAAAGGARGIGELMPDGQGVRPDDAAMDAVVAVAARLGLPVLIHASEPVGHRYPGKGTCTPERVLPLIERHPRARFILAHAGGGLPFYHLMPEVAEATRNVWYDTAAAPLLYRPVLYRRLVDLVGLDRVLFASDAPLIGLRRPLAHFAAAPLTEEERAAIGGGNLATLLGALP